MSPREKLLGLAKANCPPLVGIDGAFVRKLSYGEVMELGQEPDTSTRLARIFQVAVVDEAGASIFAAEELDLVRALPHADFGPMLRQVMVFNGMADDSIEDAEKN